MLLVGDVRQHEAVDAGRPYHQLQEAGIRTAHLDEIVRQRDPELKAVVEQLSREYKLVTYCHGWGSHRVYFYDDAGRLRKIPAGWTDVVGADPVVVVAAGRSAFRVADLLMLADLIEVLQPRRHRRAQQSAGNVSI